MKQRLGTLFDSVFRDREGKVAAWQSPNIPLWGWIVFTILTKIVSHGKLHTGFHLLAQATLFTWAYLEIRSGVSLFRRILGGIILLGIIASYFR